MEKAKRLEQLEHLFCLQYVSVLQDDLNAIQYLLLFLHRLCVPFFHEHQHEIVRILLLPVEVKAHLFLFPECLLKLSLPLIIVIVPEDALLLSEQDRFIQINLLYTLDQIILCADALRLVQLECLREFGDRILLRCTFGPFI